jgi:hypothetical protein
LIDGTDIPRVPELTLSSAQVQHERNKVSSAEFTFTGPIFDALERIRWASRGFDKDGWTKVSISGNSSEANAVFSMSWYTPGMERMANLHVVASDTHGTATILVSIEKVPKQASQPSKSN